MKELIRPAWNPLTPINGSSNLWMHMVMIHFDGLTYIQEWRLTPGSTSATYAILLHNSNNI